MTTSPFPTSQYTAEQFVESAGAILFDLSQPKICLVHLLSSDEWLLAKGRRNCGESLPQAALREVTEETGFLCKLLPVTMSTRAPATTHSLAVHEEDAGSDAPDVSQTLANITEPFMLTVRHLDGDGDGGSRNVKLIWWFIAHVVADGDDDGGKPGGEERGGRGSRPGEPDRFRPELFEYREALETLTFQSDRDVVQRALDIVASTYTDLSVAI